MELQNRLVVMASPGVGGGTVLRSLEDDLERDGCGYVYWEVE